MCLSWTLQGSLFLSNQRDNCFLFWLSLELQMVHLSVLKPLTWLLAKTLSSWLAKNVLIVLGWKLLLSCTALFESRNLGHSAAFWLLLLKLDVWKGQASAECAPVISAFYWNSFVSSIIYHFANIQNSSNPLAPAVIFRVFLNPDALFQWLLCIRIRNPFESASWGAANSYGFIRELWDIIFLNLQLQDSRYFQTLRLSSRTFLDVLTGRKASGSELGSHATNAIQNKNSIMIVSKTHYKFLHLNSNGAKYLHLVSPLSCSILGSRWQPWAWTSKRRTRKKLHCCCSKEHNILLPSWTVYLFKNVKWLLHSCLYPRHFLRVCTSLFLCFNKLAKQRIRGMT